MRDRRWSVAWSAGAGHLIESYDACYDPKHTQTWCLIISPKSKRNSEGVREHCLRQGGQDADVSSRCVWFEIDANSMRIWCESNAWLTSGCKKNLSICFSNCQRPYILIGTIAKIHKHLWFYKDFDHSRTLFFHRDADHSRIKKQKNLAPEESYECDVSVSWMWSQCGFGVRSMWWGSPPSTSLSPGGWSYKGVDGLIKGGG